MPGGLPIEPVPDDGCNYNRIYRMNLEVKDCSEGCESYHECVPCKNRRGSETRHNYHEQCNDDGPDAADCALHGRDMPILVVEHCEDDNKNRRWQNKRNKRRKRRKQQMHVLKLSMKNQLFAIQLRRNIA